MPRPPALAAAALLLIPLPAPAAPVPKAKDQSKLYFNVDGRFTRVDPDGSRPTVLFDDAHTGRDADLSPDGTRMLSVRVNERKEAVVAWRGEGGEPRPLLTTKTEAASAWWSADGKAVHCREGEEFTTVDAATGKVTSTTRVPAGYAHLGLATTGGEQVFERFRRDGTGALLLTWVTSPADEFKPAEYVPAGVSAYLVAPFPDGKRWVVRPFGEGKGAGLGVYTVGEKAAVWWKASQPDAPVAAVRPDGRRVAYVRKIVPESTRKMTYELWAADPDGENASKVTEADSPIFPLRWR